MVIKKVFIDLSGTLHIESTPTPGAINALNRLRKHQLDILFVTNTSDSRRHRYEKLKQLGFDVNINEFYTSVWGTRNYILEQKLNPMLLIDNVALEDFNDIPAGENKDSVVIGLTRFVNYDILTEAFRILLNGGKLIATHEGRYFQTSEGLALGPGMFVKGLEFAADCKAHVVGKPNPDFFIAALGNTRPTETVMIGDDVRDDIGGAQAVGIRGFLVQTGKYRQGDEELISPRPSWTVPNFEQAVNIIIDLNEQDCES